MFSRGWIDEETMTAILPKNARISYFYILPKIHKPGNPGRLIVSSCEAPQRVCHDLLLITFWMLCTNHGYCQIHCTTRNVMVFVSSPYNQVYTRYNHGCLELLSINRLMVGRYTCMLYVLYNIDGPPIAWKASQKFFLTATATRSWLFLAQNAWFKLSFYTALAFLTLVGHFWYIEFISSTLNHSKVSATAKTAIVSLGHSNLNTCCRGIPKLDFESVLRIETETETSEMQRAMMLRWAGLIQRTSLDLELEHNSEWMWVGNQVEIK